jgi:hypothetical protein
MSSTPAQSAIVGHRLQEGAREIGVLLITFAPLDVAFADAPSRYVAGSLFLLIGMLLFGVSLFARFGVNRIPDLLMIFGTMFLMFAVAVFVAWRFEVHERREQEKRERAPTA